MDASLMFSASAQPAATPVAAPGAATSGAANPVGSTDPTQSNTPNGRTFAGLMRDLLPTHERQNVAADPATDPSGLKSEALGAQLEVITASSVQPDAGSLTAFALAQGLDESAVMALFGEKPTTDIPATPSLESAAALSAALLMAQTKSVNSPTEPSAEAAGWLNMAMAKIDSSTALRTEVSPDSGNLSPDVAWLAQNLSAEITVHVSSLSPEAVSPPAVQAEVSTLTTANWLATLVTSLVKAPVNATATTEAKAPTEAMAQGMPSVTEVLINPSNLPPAHTEMPVLASPTSVGVQPLTSPAPVGVQPLTSPAPVVLPYATAINASVDTSAAVSAAASASVSAVEDLAPVAPAPQDVMRIRLVPAWENVTQQLHQMSGTAVAVAWGALTASTLGGPICSIALDLRNSASQESKALDDIDFGATTDNNMNSSGADLTRTTATGTPLPTIAQPLPGMAQTQRQEHYQQLADRLGQAMAERLQSQIARGEWKLQMRLNPASLGRIDVELDMHAKGLDAMFRSDNPFTRELMAQSMPKLKDTLTQSGMAVASVWVNSDAGRQSGGNPTPQRESTPSTDNVASAQTDSTQKAVTKEKQTPDGFDVLA